MAYTCYTAWKTNYFILDTRQILFGEWKNMLRGTQQAPHLADHSSLYYANIILAKQMQCGASSTLKRRPVNAF